MLNSTKNIKIGLFAAIIMTVNNMLGSGVYMLPASLSKIGFISFYAWPIVLLGILGFAYILSKLVMQYPHLNGLGAIVGAVFGPAMASAIDYIYSLANWIALVSLISVMLGYLENLIPALLNHPYLVIGTQLLMVWLITLICISGTRVLKFFQSVSFILSLIPLALIVVFGWMYINPDIIIHGFSQSTSAADIFTGIGQSLNIVLWSFIGIETSVAIGEQITNPTRNVSRAILGGVIIASLIYILIVFNCMMSIGPEILSKSSSPLSNILILILHSQIAVKLISISAILGIGGATIGWMNVVTQTIYDGAKSGFFPRFMHKKNSKDIPYLIFLSMACIYSIIIIITSSVSVQTQFNQIINVSVILYLIPYIFVVIAAIALAKQQLKMIIISVLVLAFFMWSIFTSDYSTIKFGFIVTLLSFIPYVFIKFNRQ